MDLVPKSISKWMDGIGSLSESNNNNLLLGGLHCFLNPHHSALICALIFARLITKLVTYHHIFVFILQLSALIIISFISCCRSEGEATMGKISQFSGRCHTEISFMVSSLPLIEIDKDWV